MRTNKELLTLYTKLFKEILDANPTYLDDNNLNNMESLKAMYTEIATTIKQKLMDNNVTAEEYDVIIKSQSSKEWQQALCGTLMNKWKELHHDDIK